MINNDAELAATIAIDLAIVIDVLTEEIMKELRKKMDKIVYSHDAKEYPRQYDNGGLYGMWEKEDASIKENIVSAEIGENPALLTHSPNDFIHGSNVWKVTNDIRDILIDIIIHEDGRMAGPLFGEGFWRAKRDFWTPLIEMIDDGTFDKVIEKEFKKLGIKFKKG